MNPLQSVINHYIENSDKMSIEINNFPFDRQMFAKIIVHPRSVLFILWSTANPIAANIPLLIKPPRGDIYSSEFITNWLQFYRPQSVY